METKINQQKLLTHLSEKWKGRSCSMCDARNWNLSDKLFELREFQGGELVLGTGPIIPLVVVTCNNCGNTVLVNAIKAGAIEPQHNQPLNVR
jgi:hypothetical protein